MRIRHLLLTFLALLGAVAFGHVTGYFHPTEKVNALWLVIAASCLYVLGLRFYGGFLERRVVQLNNDESPAFSARDGTNVYENKYVSSGSLRGPRRRRRSWPRPCRTTRLLPGSLLSSSGARGGFRRHILCIYAQEGQSLRDRTREWERDRTATAAASCSSWWLRLPDSDSPSSMRFTEMRGGRLPSR